MTESINQAPDERFSSLNDLERAVLSEIFSQLPEVRAALEAQIGAARITERWNSGGGFFVDFKVDRNAAPPAATERVIGNVWAEIEGFEQPMTFLVFMVDGYVDCLEGASVGDDTTGVDFAGRTFSIMRDAHVYRFGRTRH